MSELQAVLLAMVAQAGAEAFPRCWQPGLGAEAPRLARIANDRGWCWHCKRQLRARADGTITCAVGDA